jgi:hypothetical protein
LFPAIFQPAPPGPGAYPFISSPCSGACLKRWLSFSGFFKNMIPEKSLFNLILHHCEKEEQAPLRNNPQYPD